MRTLRNALNRACGEGTPGLVSNAYVDSQQRDPHFAIVPMFGLTQAQAIALADQWHRDVCGALGVDPGPRPAQAPTLALSLLDGWADNADRERDGRPIEPGPDDPGGGAA